MLAPRKAQSQLLPESFGRGGAVAVASAGTAWGCPTTRCRAEPIESPASLSPKDWFGAPAAVRADALNPAVAQ